MLCECGECNPLILQLFIVARVWTVHCSTLQSLSSLQPFVMCWWNSSSSSPCILQTMFLDRRFSDITLTVLGRDLLLHRSVLFYVPYFKPFLEGAWKDAGSKGIHIAIDDPLITAQTFEDIIASVYSVPLSITEGNVKSLIATASFLQLENVCSDCVEFCRGHLSLANVIEYAKFSYLRCYIGRSRLSQACKEFLWVHAMDVRNDMPELPFDLLSEILQSDNLWVRTEYDRFRLVIDVFQAKFAACSQHRSLDEGIDSLAPAPKREKREREAISVHIPANEESPKPVNIAEDWDKGEIVFADLLSKHIRYSAFSVEQTPLAFAEIDRLQIPVAMRALAAGMMEAHAFHSAVLLNNGSVDLSKVSVQGGWEGFRFGVEWGSTEERGFEPPRHLYGGWVWRIFCIRTGTRVKVHVLCSPCMPESQNCNAHLEFPADVSIICKDRKRVAQSQDSSRYVCRDFISLDELPKYVTCTGGLRITAVVTREQQHSTIGG
eukprot:evm.model.scf_193.7 EVM.evm.TU.scf_193.7   scf_193:61686-63161(+)